MRIVVFTLVAVGMSATLMGAQTDIPRPEHPRPDFQRSPWVNLNGTWDFDFDPSNVGEKEEWFEPGQHKWSQKIVVPFPWESELSGIQKPDYRGVGWYHRKVSAPRDWKGKRIVLVFGAIDWAARVWLDGKAIGFHENGYLPFEFDATDWLKDGREHDLAVRAEDNVDAETPTGKQTGWYTPSSGIWQTVYLEARGWRSIEGFQLYPDLNAGSVRIELRVRAEKTAGLIVAAESPKNEFEKVSTPVSGGNASLVIKPLQVRLWSPESPHLYDIRFQLLSGPTVEDEVVSYVALRKIETGRWGDQPFESVLLNGKPIYVQAALHQSFNPKGIYTYPSDEAIQHDLKFTRDCGLNSLRVHIKVEEPRFYYWADKLGILIWYDLPNFRSYTERSRANWETTLRGAVARDFNHPSIFCWVLFNETWGIGDGGYDADHQAWVRSMYELAKKLDTTRLCEDNSANRRDHVACDLNTWHFYINDYERARERIAEVVKETYAGSTFNFAEGYKQGNQPLLNSEYGGIGAGLGDQDISYCLHYLTNLLRSHNKIQGFVYTELTDIEWEHNGLANYDRTPKEFGYPNLHGPHDPTTVRDIFNPDFVVLDGPPIRNVKSGEAVEVPVSISHYSSFDIVSPKIEWGLEGISLLGDRVKSAALDKSRGERFAKVQRYSVVEQEPLKITFPNERGLYLLTTYLAEGTARRPMANNWMWFNAIDAPSPRVEKLDDTTVVLRFDPSASLAPDESGDLSLRGDKAATPDKYIGYGKGWVEYRVTIPKFIDPKTIGAIDLIMEMAPKARDEKLDWPARKKPVDYPQTDGRKFPSRVVVSLNGVRTAEWTLEDDPADERGILSHQKRQQPGSYGYLQRAKLSLDEKSAARNALERDGAIVVRLDYGPIESQPSGGLAIFGETNGAYPVEPTLLLSMTQPVTIPEGYDVNAPLTSGQRAKPRALLPTVGFGEAQWKYTFPKPPTNWTAPDFDDSTWKTGRHGFGRKGTPNTQVNTPWETDDIWLRWKGEIRPLPASAPVWIDYYHDEDMEVYVNGKLLLRERGHVTEYQTQRLTDEQRALFVEGENTIAVHCRQTAGGQFIDVGLFTRGNL